MKVKYWQKSSFKRIKKRWYEKLKQSGFIDEERNSFLIQRSSNVYRQASRVIRECKEEYFSLLAHNLSEDPPRCTVEELILQRRSEGYKINEISKELQELGKKCHRQTIRFIIRRYEHKWGIRKWSHEKLHPKWMKYRKVPIK